MLAENIKNLIIEKLEISEGAGGYYRSKNDFHTEFLKNAKKTTDAEDDLKMAVNNSARAHVVRGHQAKVDNLRNISYALIDAADNHHGHGVGDTLRDHAYMTLNPTHVDVQTGETVDDYNSHTNTSIRATHGIKADKNLEQKTIPVAVPVVPTHAPKHVQPVQPVAHKKDKHKKVERNVVGKLLRGSDLLRWFPSIGVKKHKE